MRTPTKLTPQIILYQLVSEIPQNNPNIPYREYVFVILGQPGPTGKTWLCDQLRVRDYTSYELPFETYNFVDFADKKNHYVVDHINKMVTIILNERL